MRKPKTTKRIRTMEKALADTDALAKELLFERRQAKTREAALTVAAINAVSQREQAHKAELEEARRQAATEAITVVAKAARKAARRSADLNEAREGMQRLVDLFSQPTVTKAAPVDPSGIARQAVEDYRRDLEARLSQQ